LTDSNDDVREELAQHPNLPAKAKKTLSRDSSQQIRVAIARREDHNDAMLKVLIQDEAWEVRQVLAYARVEPIPIWVLEQLANDPSEHVRWQVAYSWSTPQATLEQLRNDKIESVRQAALETLRVTSSWTAKTPPQ
jgi:hypothetical protein